MLEIVCDFYVYRFCSSCQRLIDEYLKAIDVSSLNLHSFNDDLIFLDQLLVCSQGQSDIQKLGIFHASQDLSLC